MWLPLGNLADETLLQDKGGLRIAAMRGKSLCALWLIAIHTIWSILYPCGPQLFKIHISCHNTYSKHHSKHTKFSLHILKFLAHVQHAHWCTLRSRCTRFGPAPWHIGDRCHLGHWSITPQSHTQPGLSLFLTYLWCHVQYIAYTCGPDKCECVYGCC